MNKKTRKWVQSVFQEQIDLIKAHSINLKNQPDDAEPVHQFRVRSRHLRSLLSFFEPELSRKWVKNVNTLLKQNAKHFSATRELDVIQEYAQEFESENLHNNKLMKLIIDKSTNTRVDAIERFNSNSFNESLEDFFQKIPFKQSKELKKKKLQKRLNKSAKQIIKNTDSIDLQDYQTMHNYRINVKKLRYSTSSMSQFLKHDVLNLASVKKLSEELGVLTDVYFIRNMLPYIVNEGDKEVTEFLEFLHTKEQLAYKNCLIILQKEEKEV